MLSVNEHSKCDLILQAISFAARAHGGQLRKDHLTPYAAHPMRVMTVVAQVFNVNDPELLATALLHDTIEDTTTDFDDLAEQFGQRVAQNVALLTKDMRLQEEVRESAYFDTLANAPPEVQICKLADAYDNLIDSEHLPPEGRAKAVRKASELLRLFHARLAQQWPHVLEAVEQQVERTSVRSNSSFQPKNT